MREGDAIQQAAHGECAVARALVGRDAEVAAVEALVDGHARGGVLVVRGASGMGKSSLLAVAQERAAECGLGSARVTGVAAEASFAYAGLYALLRPLLGGADRLAQPQRAALDAALGMTDGVDADPFMLALATLELLVHAGSVEPLLVVVDDAHWLDRETVGALAFVARRLASEPVVLLFAIGDQPGRDPDVSGLPSLQLTGLDDAAAAQILEERAPGLSSLLRARVIEQAAGNPLALVEHAAALAGCAGFGPTPTVLELPLGDRLSRIFAPRLAALSTCEANVLLLAACDDRARIAELHAAAESLGEQPATVAAAIAMAVDASLLVLEGPVARFGHPLVRSAVYQRAGTAARQAAHAALADAVQLDALRSAWHRAAATMGLDAAVAAELHAAAIVARTKGRGAEAFSAFERAAWLTDAKPARARSLLAAAGAAFDLGWPDTGRRLVRAAGLIEVPATEQVLTSSARRMITDEVGGEADIDDLLAYAHAEDDLPSARRMVFRAAINSEWARPDETTRASIGSATRALELEHDDPWRLAITAIVGSLDEKVAVDEQLALRAADGADGPEGAFALALAAIATAREGAAERFLAHAVGGLRDQGRAGLVTQVLAVRAWVHVGLSHLEAAATDAVEAAALATTTEQPLWGARALAASALIAAMRGAFPEAELLADAADRQAVPRGASAAIADVLVARGHASLAQGQHAAAERTLAHMYGGRERVGTAAQRLAAIGDYAEASVRSGAAEAAREALADLALDLPRATLEEHCGFALAEALLAEDGAAEGRFGAAMERSLHGSPFARARIQLAFGTWLRRRRRVVESREPLESAAAALEALGAAPWAHRARQELRATGVSSERASPSPLELTPQERLIAELAAAGLSNQEIGRRLYLSPRTIGSHLYRIFPKLGISSRGELHRVLAAHDVLVAV